MGKMTSTRRKTGENGLHSWEKRRSTNLHVFITVRY